MLARTGISVQNPVLRHNYGVLFKPYFASKPLIRDFVHFNLTLRIKIKGPGYACNLNSTDIMGNKLKLLNEEVNVLASLINDIYIKTRHRRALLLIGGKILKAIFGVVTEPDIQKLKTVLQILDHTIHDDKHYRVERDTLIAKLAHSHHLLINLVKIHINEAQTILNNQERNIHLINKFNLDLMNKLVANVQSRDCLWKIMQTQMHFESLVDLIYALDRLSFGYLSRELIPVNKLIQAMDMWDMILFRNFTMKLAQRSTRYFYNTKLILNFKITSEEIAYCVKIPASWKDSNFAYYKIIIFKVPTMTHNHSIQGYTLIENRAKFLMINSSHFTMQYHPERGTLPMAYQSINSTTCFTALFLDLKFSIIKSLCTFDYYPGRTPEFKHIPISENTHLILTSELEGFIVCEDKNDTQILLTPLTIIELPCKCTLMSNTFALSSKGQTCEVVSDYTINTGINLPLFLSINIDVNHLGGGDLLNLSTPELHEMHVNFTRQIKILDLQDSFVRDIIGRAERLIQQDRKYSTPSIFGTARHIYDYGPIISSFILSVLSLCVSFYLLYRLHGLFAILLGFRSALGANLTLTNWEVPDLASLNLTFLSTNKSILADSIPDPGTIPCLQGTTLSRPTWQSASTSLSLSLLWWWFSRWHGASTGREFTVTT